VLIELFRSSIRGRATSGYGQALILVAVILLGASAGYVATRDHHNTKTIEVSSQAKRGQRYHPTDAQWASLTVETVEARAFPSDHITEGKIAVDEDRSTPIFSPYAGRVTRLMVKPGDDVQRDQPLFVVEATDMVQAQNDFIAASGGMNKARSRLNLAQIVEKRNKDLYEGKAVALKDWQNAQAELIAAQNDVRSGEVALEAARNRLRILGRSDAEIAAFDDKGIISPETPIYAPIAGTIVQRKVGPGQYVSSGSSEPVFVIGDLSTVWLLAYVRESDAPKVRVGQTIDFTVLAYSSKTFSAKISYVATALESATRRLLVRAAVDNPHGLLKPEMFANVAIHTEQVDVAPAIPRSALIHDGDKARVWVVLEDKAIELRQVKPGPANGRLIQVLEGLKPGEKIITKGSLFINRSAPSS
jgi:cobalt-zinc-cadmium efflux system membrane fusion protein